MKKPTAQERKETPIFSGVIKYFPDAIAYLAKVSLAGGKQHDPESELSWNRSKSGDELDALARHLVDVGTYDDDGVRHSGKVLWRAAANLQKEIEQSCTTEIYKDVPGYEKMYKVSNLGNVKSLDRYKSPGDHLLSKLDSVYGYKKVTLCKDGKNKQEDIHRIMARAFYDSEYTEKGLVCDHKDRDRSNNILSNLRIVTPRENVTNTDKPDDNVIGAHRRENGKYRATIRIGGSNLHLGTFDTAQEAGDVYQNALANIE